MTGSEPTLTGSERPRESVLRLATNTMVQIGGSLVASALGLVTFVAVTRGLGAVDFGVLTTALVYLMIPVILADVGLTTYVVREISAQPERTAAVMQAAMPLRALVSAAAVGVAVAVAYVLPYSSDVRTLIAIGSIGSFCTLMTQGLAPVLQVQLKMHWSVVATLAGRAAILVLTLAVLAADGGLDGVMAANVAGTAVTFCLQLAIVARIVSLRPRLDYGYWRTLLRGSIAIGLALAIAQIYFRIDVLLLAALRDSVEVGLYGAAVKLLELAELVAAAIGITVFPLLARYVRSDPPRMRLLFQRTFDLLLAAAGALVVLMTVTAAEIVVLLSGEEFREAGDALRLLAPYVLLSFVTGLLWRALIAYGEDRALLALAVGILSINVALNLVVIPAYGFRGAAVTTIVTESIGLATALALLWRRHRLLPSVRYGLVVLPAVLVMAAVLVWLPGPFLVRAILAGAAYVGVLLALPGTVRVIASDSLFPVAQRALGSRR